uniref:Tar ligand binding domain-containing protein n=1 Tax=Hydrogenophaga sp. OTU3427 TaxID=3043856 RepID=UPI00313AD278
MNHLKISTRLLILIGVLSALLVAIGAIGLFGMSTTNAAFNSVYVDRMIPVGQLADVQRLVLRNRMVITESLVDSRPESVADDFKAIAANVKEIDGVWAAYMATRLTPEEAQLAKAFEASRVQFLDGVLRPMQEALRKQDVETAKRLHQEKMDTLYDAVRNNISALVKLQFDEGKKEFNAAVERYETIRTASIAAIVLGIAFAVVFGWMLVRGISRALGEAIDTASAVAEGNLTRNITTSGKDEVALLLQALSHMQDGLRRVVGAVRQGSEAVSTASSEIAEGNQDLSARTEAQASALEETAASMEELSSTVKQNA